MDLSKQVCTLEQAKKLKELGIEGSYLHHFQGGVHTEAWGDDYCPAFSVAELGVMLPNEIRNHSLYHVLGHCNNGHISGYSTDGSDYWIMCGPFKTEAQARASLLIYLLENNHTTPEEVNTRLNNQ